MYWHALDEAARTSPSKTAFIFEGEHTTYKQIDEIFDRLAAGLLRLGFRHGDRIGIIAHTIQLKGI